MALPSPRSVASAFDVSLPVVLSGGMTFLFYVETILFAYCKNKYSPTLHVCAKRIERFENTR